MRYLLGLYLTLLGADLAALSILTVKRLLETSGSFTVLEFSPLFVGAGVLIALITLSYNQTRSLSEDYLESATDFLSKAFDTLDQKKDKDGRPVNDRLVWLTAARLIAISETISDKIILKSHKLIWQEQQEYWRGRFRDLVSPTREGFPPEYYADKPQDYIHRTESTRAPLAEKSLAVIYRFVEWPKNRVDPLSKHTLFSDEEIVNMGVTGPRGLSKILQEKQSLEHKR
ncbi:TPA: hypothetical protein NID23_005733 [Pseudomonas aeruginosa]|nr:hypothetical protein [Pseudomonas aeruginosa]